MLEAILPTALGDFGLTYDYFMDLTPKQWAYCVKGHQQREERQFRRLAWVTCHLMNVSGNLKHPVTVDMLLNNNTVEETSEPKKLDFDELGKWVAE